MVYLAGMVFGAIALSKMEVDLLPRVEHPELSIITLYPGASPREVESLVTRPVEEAASGVPGVRRVRSESIEGASLVTAAFEWGADMDFATIKMREKVDFAKGALPQDAEKSIIARFDPTAQPVAGIAIRGRDGGVDGLRQMVHAKIKPLFERIDGVACARIAGGRTREVQVRVDQSRLYANGLGLGDVIESVQLSNYNFPAGSVTRGAREFVIRTIGEFTSLADIENVLVRKSARGGAVYVRDVAEVVDGYRDRDSISYHNGAESIGLAVVKEAGSNTVRVCAAVRDLVSEINARHRGAIELAVCYDGSRYITSAVDNVVDAAVLGAVIAFFVILFFLRDVKSSLVIIAVTPPSVLITVLAMYLRGIGLNMMSLGGLAIGVGMLVDCAIVVIDSVHARLAAGEDLRAACRGAIAQDRAALFVSTLTTVVVFFPVVFVRGIAGQVFSDLAFTISVSIVVSFIVSITLTPALLVLLERRSLQSGGMMRFATLRRLAGVPALRHAIAHGRAALERAHSLLERSYTAYLVRLERSLEGYRRALIIGVALVIGGFLMFAFLDTSLFPRTNSGSFSVRIVMPPGTPIDDTREAALRVDAALAALPFVENRFIDVGYNPGEISEHFGREKSHATAELVVTLKRDRGVSTEAAMRVARRAVALPPEIAMEFFSEEREFAGFMRLGASTVLVDVTGDDFDAIEQSVAVLTAAFEKTPGIARAVPHVAKGKPEVRLVIDRAKLAAFGLALGDVAGTVRAAVRGEDAGKFYEADDQADISVRLRAADRSGLASLGGMLVRVGESANVPLAAFSATERQSGYNKITRRDQRRTFSIALDAEPGTGRGAAIAEAAGAIERVRLPHGVHAAVSRDMDEVRDSLAELAFSLALSMLLIFMILAAQFESLTRPLYIMLIMPLTAAGVSVPLLFTGNSVNVISLMGTVLLSGSAVNAAIVLVDYIQARRDRGIDLRAAVIGGCRERLRPILMSTCTNALGIVPLAIGLREGGEMQSPIAIVFFGGIAVSTFCTLALLPAYYYHYESRAERTGKRSANG